MGGPVYDSLNREMILIGGWLREDREAMPTCRYERKSDRWIDLETKALGKMGVGQGTCVYDPEHNVILEIISGAAYRFRNVRVGTSAFYGRTSARSNPEMGALPVTASNQTEGRWVCPAIPGETK